MQSDSAFPPPPPPPGNDLMVCLVLEALGRAISPMSARRRKGMGVI